MGLIQRAIQVIRKSLGSGKKRTFKKNKSQRISQRGGAILGFDLNQKIGGQASNVSLNGTGDGDCPPENLSNLGMINYGVKTNFKSGGGGGGGGGKGKGKGKHKKNGYKTLKNHKKQSKNQSNQ